MVTNELLNSSQFSDLDLRSYSQWSVRAYRETSFPQTHSLTPIRSEMSGKKVCPLDRL